MISGGRWWMADLKLFRVGSGPVTQLPGTSMPLEKSLQTLFEANLETLLGVTFLASEFPTTNGGRMDTLGIDENLCPVIVEYKRATNENVINQGLFYLDWLMDHRADFKLLVMERLGSEQAAKIEWSAPRLVCIAGDFTKFDENAIRQMNRNIELIRYRRFGDGLMLLELLTSVTGRAVAPVKPVPPAPTTGAIYKTIAESLASAPTALVDLFTATTDYLRGLDDAVQVKQLLYYHAFKRIKNFACLEIRPTAGKVLLYLKVDPLPDPLIPGFTRDMRNISHFGTGNLEVTLVTPDDLERAKPLMVKSYDAS
jgi:predicted transport protein